MSVKKLFDKNKQAVTVGKYLRLSAPDTLGDGIESEAHLKASLQKQDYVLPPINYSNPEEFVKFGSAEQYYKNAFEYILSYYPYDGSEFEKVDFYNKLNPVEKYFFEEIYPTSTGFIQNGVTYGAITPHPSGYASSSAQYVQVKGGPHKNTFYNVEQDRTSNLEFGGPDGTTVEFFYKKAAAIDHTVESPRQVVFDLWNGASTTSDEYGRLRIEVVTGSSDHFEVTFRSGSTGFDNVVVPTATTPINDDTWRNFSFVFNTTSSSPTLDFFANGTCIQTGIAPTVAGAIGTVTGSMIANIGALRTTPAGAGFSGVDQGYGKLSASLDEFRFWKTARNDEEIGRYWFANVGGGSNKYDVNVSLGVYFKFNEGITTNAAVDQVIMDYSGRLSNGLYVGYNSTNTRNTASAINQLKIESIHEFGDPIVRSSNPNYTTLLADYILTGSNYDYQNNARLLNHLPNWIIEEEEQGSNEIVSLTQIMANYFDTIYNQITYIKNLRYMDYVSGSLSSSYTHFPYNDRLVENLGIEAPELFANAGTLQQFLQRDEQINFDDQLEDIKNSIYKNIYNNLNFILKSKGNEKAIRNFIRCLGVDDEIIALNTYPNNADFELVSNYKAGVSTKKFADFTAHLDQADDEAIVYQYYDSTNPNSVGTISGSTSLGEFAFTLQSELDLAVKQDYRNLGYNIPQVVTASVMGFHTPADSSPTITDTTWAAASSDYGLQVQVIKSPGEYPEIFEPAHKVKDAYFLVKDREGKTLLTSSIFNNVYDNTKWNLALSLRPERYQFSDGVIGSAVAQTGYTLELYGVNYQNGIKKYSFSSATDLSATSGSNIIESAKKVYLGASRFNFTGSTLVNTDIRGSSVRYWTDYLPNSTVDHHAKEVDTYGRLNPYRNAYEFQSAAPNVYIPKIQTLALNWDFADISGSDSSGRFMVTDYSSGSNVQVYPNEYQGPVFSNINLREHTGRGDFFKSSFTPVRKQYVYTDHLQIPEYVGGDNMVNVPTSDDETFGIYLRPIDFFFAVERSMYRSISNRMLEMFASIEEFNNIIGEPVNKYRLNYKRMEKLREIFFRRVKNDIPDFDKYLRYYKWIDTAMGEMIQELFPVSAKYAPEVRKVVESHVLERPKIQHKLTILRDKHPVAGITGSLGAGFGSVCRTSPGWKFKHAPIPALQSRNCNWWRTRAERDVPPLIASGGNLTTRNAVLNAVQKQVDGTNFLCVDGQIVAPIYGGINQYLNKKRRIRDYTFDQFKSLEDCDDVLDPMQKKLVPFRATKDGVNYKGAQLTPFTAISSSLTTGYNAQLNSLGLTGISLNNLHEDSISPYRHSVPLQGPFTKRWVGGIQARHVAPFRTIDRREEYNLTITSGTGSVTTITTGIIPKGQYLRGLSSKSPVNLANIKTIITGSTPGDGVRKVGNFERNYEVVQGNSRFETNIDFIFNNSRYQYSMPSAFITPPARRTSGLTGSADYPAPRQVPNRRKTEVILVDMFASPGSKEDSKQQFRDVNSDQFSPNSALPFRNLAVINPYLKRLGTHSTFGGYQYDPATGAPSTTPSATKIQRNTVLRLEMGFSGAATPTTVGTASVYDDGFVTRPVPNADRAQWTSYLSGSENASIYDQYVALGSRYPANITFVTQSATAYPSTFSNSLITNAGGKSEFVWANNRDYVSWKQMQAGNSQKAQYFWQNNLYELLPQEVVTLNDEVKFDDGSNGSIATKTRTIYSRNGQAEPHYYSQRFREAPITSRYKALLHQMRTPIGTPSKTSERHTSIAMEYTYGNMLMGFANRELNEQIQGDVKFAHGKIKRPYEVLRDQFVENVQRSVNGAELIKDFTYRETIYPKEVYTYLSQSRARQAFVYSHWRDDAIVTGSAAVTSLTDYSKLISRVNIDGFNRQSTRLKGDFVTSQGYPVQNLDQVPYEDPSSLPAGPGSGSIWPLDSYLYSDFDTSLVTVLTASTPVVLADAGTMAAGELMMTHYGTINDRITDPGGSLNNGTAVYITSSINSAQYVYNVPVTKVDCTTTSAVAAVAAITASRGEGEGLTTATGQFVLGSSADGSSLFGAVTLEIQDLTSTKTFKFVNNSNSNTFDAGTNTYEMGVENPPFVGVYFTKEECRNQLFSAIESARVDASPLNIALPAKSGTDTIDLTAGTAGTAWNSRNITSNDTGVLGVAVTSWAGATDYTYNSKTLDLEDVAHGVVSYIFDAATAPGASTDTIIGTFGATATSDVIAAIAQTISLSQAAGAINITPGTVAGSTVPLTADVAGTAMNGKPVAGTAETDGGVTTVAFAAGAAASTVCVDLPEPRSPGSVYTRPAWTAGVSRIYVDGPNKRQSAAQSRPFYDTYEKYVENIRLAGKEKTIMPEFRISEHIKQYQQNGSLLSIVSASLELTGANHTMFNGVNSSFYQRFAETDKLEFLGDFMPDDILQRDFIFNNYPRHFELGSEAIVKMLPYDGFYPANRSLEIAALFRDAYIGNAVLTGTSGSATSAWRSLLRPFLAPGILYNSIKSGIAVDYPIRRTTRNLTQYLSSSATLPLHGCLSGTLSVSNAPGTIPGNRRRNLSTANWQNADINSFFWADRLPFETLVDPVPALKTGESLGTVLSDLNEYLYLDATGSISAKSLNDTLYKKAMSNFLANVPKFFLKKKTNKYGPEGYLTKFVSQFGAPPKDGQQNTAPERTVEVEKDAAYMMEIGLLKTENFNQYSNPYAFGIPTSTGSVDWHGLTSDELPKGREQNWPKHRGEFAPFTPPYYYGPSLVRMLFMPRGDKNDYTLDEILNNDRGELFVQYLNESGSYYDMTSGSFIDRDNNVVTSVATPSYGWNRAWQNRMDIDASVNIFNTFPTSTGTSYRSTDPNKWTIMPKWECPVLDFPSSQTAEGVPSYQFSASVGTGTYYSGSKGMWHQYGVQPDNDEGVYMYIKDIPTGNSEEYDFVAITYLDGATAKRTNKYVKKVPKFVSDAERTVKSLGDLVGFDSEEIIRNGIDFSKAKRLGELGEDNEKSLSEAVLALPVYFDKDQKPRIIPLRAPADKLGPKIKEFRKRFTKFSLPPALANGLLGLVPQGYPNIPDLINPFGPDDYDQVLDGTKMLHTPVVYLLEHKISLTKQDLADMWQGVMPDISQRFNMSYTAVDHYLPGDNVEETATKFPEVLKEQIILDIPRNERDGHPRYDLLDISGLPDLRGVYPEIRWLVFKVKERGLVGYDQMVMEEVDGVDALSYEKVNGFLSAQGLTPESAARFMGTMDNWAKTVYSYKHSLTEGSYNWPYDHFSLVELNKLDTKFVFRPELEREYTEESRNNPLPGEGQIPEGGLEIPPLGAGLGLNLGAQNNDE